jgi:DNA-binding NarL/FixJ family response regulator
MMENDAGRCAVFRGIVTLYWLQHPPKRRGRWPRLGGQQEAHTTNVHPYFPSLPNSVTIVNEVSAAGPGPIETRHDRGQQGIVSSTDLCGLWLARACCQEVEMSQPAASTLPPKSLQEPPGQHSLQTVAKARALPYGARTPSDLPESQEQDRYRIAWIDNFSLSRDCILKSMSELQPNLEVFTFVAFEECLSHAVPRFNLIIMNWHVSYDNCLSALKTLRAAFKMSLIVILWSLEEREQIDKMRQALTAGASGLISTRTMGLSMALTAIRFVQAGGIFVPKEILLSEPAPPIIYQPPQDDPIELTSRQTAVMNLLKKGAPNKTIAAELGMSESTVKVHVRSILMKMGATNRTQAVFKARDLA